MPSIVVGRDRIIRWMSPDIVEVYGDRTGYEWGTNTEATPPELLAEMRALMDRALAGEWVPYRTPLACGIMIPTPGAVLVTVAMTAEAPSLVSARRRYRASREERLAASRP